MKESLQGNFLERGRHQLTINDRNDDTKQTFLLESALKQRTILKFISLRRNYIVKVIFMKDFVIIY